jgi:PAS domain S-box-containing protein
VRFRKTLRMRVSLLILIMAVVTLLVNAVSSVLQYRTAMSEETARLLETAKVEAGFIEGLARYVGSVDPDSFRQVVAAEIVSANAQYPSANRTEETTVAKREGDTIVYIALRHGTTPGAVTTVPFDSERAQPMRLALQNRSGSMVGTDYRGARVLAAYLPLPTLGWGLVSKIDVEEVQAPFLRAMGLSSAIALILVFLGARLFVRVSNPLLRRLADSEERFRSVIETAGEAILNIDSDGRIVLWNKAAESIFGYTADEAIGKPHSMLLPVGVQDRFGKTFASMSQSTSPWTPGNSIEVVGLKRGGVEFPIEMCLSAWHAQSGTTFTSVLRDISERKRADAERNRLITKLEAALADVRQLSGILPICASCKRIRNEEGKWEQVETYVHEHSEARFSHGLCPECARKLYPELSEDHSQVLE